MVALSESPRRVVWDLQADRKHLFEDLDESQLGKTQFVPAGSYKATVTLGKEKADKSFRVLPAPNTRR